MKEQNLARGMQASTRVHRRAPSQGKDWQIEKRQEVENVVVGEWHRLHVSHLDNERGRAREHMAAVPVLA